MKAKLLTMLLAVSAGTAFGAAVYSRINIPALSVTDIGNVGVYGGRSVRKAFDGSGMSADWTTHANSSGQHYWTLNGGSTTKACALIPLPADSNRIDRIVIFGCNWLNGASDLSNRSMKNFSIWYGNDGTVASADDVRERYTQLDLGTDELPQPVGAPANYTGVTFDLDEQISASYLAFLPTTCWGGGNLSVGEVVLYEKLSSSDGKPELEGGALVRGMDGALAVTGIVSGVSALAGYAAAADGGTIWQKGLTAEPVAAGAGFSLPVTNDLWVQEKVYDFYAIAENENGAVSNEIGRAYVGTAYTNWNVWIANPGSSCQASDPSHWSKCAVPGVDPPRPLLSGNLSNADIRWTVGENGLPSGILPPIRCSDYTGRFFLTSSSSIIPSAAEPFVVGGLQLALTGSGSSFANPRELRLAGSEWTVSNEFLNTSTIINRIILSDGAKLSVGELHVGLDTMSWRSNAVVRVEGGCLLRTEGEVRFTQRTALIVEGVADVGSVVIGSNSTDLGIDGGSFTNRGTMLFNKRDTGDGAWFRLYNGGRFIQQGDARFDIGVAKGSACRVTLASGGLFEAQGALVFGNSETAYPNCTNFVAISGAQTRLTAATLGVYDTHLAFALPATGFAAAPVAVSGAAVFGETAEVSVDLTGAEAGTYVLMTAGSIQGLSPSRIRLTGTPAGNIPAQVKLSATTIKVRLGRAGLAVLVR